MADAREETPRSEAEIFEMIGEDSLLAERLRRAAAGVIQVVLTFPANTDRPEEPTEAISNILRKIEGLGVEAVHPTGVALVHGTREQIIEVLKQRVFSRAGLNSFTTSEERRAGGYFNSP